MTAFDLLSKPWDQSSWLVWGSPWIWLLYNSNLFPNSEWWCELTCFFFVLPSPPPRVILKDTYYTHNCRDSKLSPFGESAFWEAPAVTEKPWNPKYSQRPCRHFCPIKSPMCCHFPAGLFYAPPFFSTQHSWSQRGLSNPFCKQRSCWRMGAGASMKVV